MASRQSAAMPTSGRRTLPSSAGSMSTWTILAPGAKAPTLPDAISFSIARSAGSSGREWSGLWK